MTRNERRLSVLLAVAAVGLLGGPRALHAYQQHVRRILPAYDPGADVLVLGASNMSRWPERAPESYRATFGPSTTSAASPGWTTEILLSHLPLATAARVVVLGDLGSPDLREGRSPVDAATGVRAVVDGLLATTDAAIVVVALPGRMLGPADGCARVDETNAWTAAFLVGLPGVTFVDLDVPHDDAHYLDDGSHLSPAGYDVLAAVVGPAVDAARGAP